MTLVSFVNFLWSFLAVVAQVISLALILSLLFPKIRQNRFIKIFSDKAIWVALIVSMCATVGSLIYSDVIGYEPCKLCWYQRIFMYPLVLLSAVAIYRKDFNIKLYIATMSVIGAFVSGFHYIGQLGYNPMALDCLAMGYSSSCAKNFVLQFGYITIPLMAFSAFLLIALTSIVSILNDKWNTKSSTI